MSDIKNYLNRLIFHGIINNVKGWLVLDTPYDFVFVSHTPGVNSVLDRDILARQHCDNVTIAHDLSLSIRR